MDHRFWSLIGPDCINKRKARFRNRKQACTALAEWMKVVSIYIGFFFMAIHVTSPCGNGLIHASSCLNPSSLMDGKINAICSSIISNHTDVFLICESWITDKNGSFVDANFSSSISGFASHHVPRCKRRGEGLAILIRSNLKLVKNTWDSFKSMEIMDYNIHSGSDLMHVILVYRPPYSSTHKITVKTFLNEFGILMERALTSPGHLVVLGDLNVHVDDPHCADGKQFIDLFTSFGLVQHIVRPTHVKGHTLDVVLTRVADPWPSNFVIDSSMPSDHASIHFVSTLHRPPPVKVAKQHHVPNNIDNESLKNSITCSSLEDLQSNADVNALCQAYNSGLVYAIDEHAPRGTKTL